MHGRRYAHGTYSAWRTRRARTLPCQGAQSDLALDGYRGIAAARLVQFVSRFAESKLEYTNEGNLIDTFTCSHSNNDFETRNLWISLQGAYMMKCHNQGAHQEWSTMVSAF